MANLNKVYLIGRLTRPPEPIQPNGTVIGARLGFACSNRRRNRQSGEWEDVSVFVDITVWNISEGSQHGTRALETLHKGSQVYVEGKLTFETWVDRNSQEQRSKLSVICDNWQYLDPKPTIAEGQSSPTPTTTQTVAEEINTPAEQQPVPTPKAPPKTRKAKEPPLVTANAKGGDDDVPF